MRHSTSERYKGTQKTLSVENQCRKASSREFPLYRFQGLEKTLNVDENQRFTWKQIRQVRIRFIRRRMQAQPAAP